MRIEDLLWIGSETLGAYSHQGRRAQSRLRRWARQLRHVGGRERPVRRSSTWQEAYERDEPTIDCEHRGAVRAGEHSARGFVQSKSSPQAFKAALERCWRALSSTSPARRRCSRGMVTKTSRRTDGPIGASASTACRPASRNRIWTVQRDRRSVWTIGIHCSNKNGRVVRPGRSRDVG